MGVAQNYEPALPRTIADLVHKYGLTSVIAELAAYCEVEWVQAARRDEPSERWYHVGQALGQVAQNLISDNEIEHSIPRSPDIQGAD